MANHWSVMGCGLGSSRCCRSWSVGIGIRGASGCPIGKRWGHPVRAETGIPWEDLPQEMECGSGMTCWRRLRDWNEAGVWERLHQVLLDELQDEGQLDWSRAIVDSSHMRAKGGARRQDPRPSIAAGRAPSTT